MRPVTPKQLETLEFVKEWQKKNGFSPTIREIAKHFRINTPSAQQRLNVLQEKKLLHRVAGQGRALKITDDSLRHDEAMFKLVGAIPAGTPQMTDESAVDIFRLTPDWFSTGDVVMVKVMGDSMLGDSIRDGDLAVIRLQSTAAAYEIAAIRLDYGEMTLKRIECLGEETMLISSNPSYPPRRVLTSSVQIVGTLQGLIRRHSSRKAPH